MATGTRSSRTGDAAILARLIRPDDDTLTPDAARALLNIRYTEHDLTRIHELVVKNQDDALSPPEKDELESYLRVGSFLDLMHATARRALKKQR